MHGGAIVSSKLPTGNIEVRVFSHATEDEEKVLAAVCNVLPNEVSEGVVFQRSSLTGHHGNPILILEANIKEKQALPLVLDKIGRGLSSLDKETFEREINLHLEKRNLYLRFDKQAAFICEFKFSSNDPIHFKIHFKNQTVDAITDLCKEYGLLP